MPESDQCYSDPDLTAKDSDGNPTDWNELRVSFAGRGFRLPKEAEWELVCRAGMMSAYSFGHDVQLLGRYGWWADSSANWSHPVGRLRPNARGLFDVHGNMWEWCHDWYGDYLSDAVDGVDSKVGPYRGARGGCWNVGAAPSRSGFRNKVPTSWRSHNLGFRLVFFPTGPAEDQLSNP